MSTVPLKDRKRIGGPRQAGASPPVLPVTSRLGIALHVSSERLGCAGRTTRGCPGSSS